MLQSRALSDAGLSYAQPIEPRSLPEYVHRNENVHQASGKTEPVQTRRIRTHSHDQLFQNRHIRDSEKEAEAAHGAEKILESYSSILGDLDDEQAPAINHHDHLDQTPSNSAVRVSPRSAGPASTQPQPITKQTRTTNEQALPDFVLKARAEVADADYIRNHDDTGPRAPMHPELPRAAEDSRAARRPAREARRPSPPG